MSLRRFLNQQGMTLVEIMVAAGLLGGISLITMKLMDDQAKNQAYLKTSAEIQQAVLKIESYLTNPEICKSMLAGKTVPSTLGTGSVDPSVLSYTRPSDGQVINVIGEKNYGDYSIPNNGITLASTVFATTISEMNITFNIENKSFFARNAQPVTKKISFVAQLNAGVIEACGPVLKDSESVGKEKMCTTLGGAAFWDGTKCVLNSVSCPYGQVATRLTSLGGVICEDIKTQIHLHEIFDTTGMSCTGKSNLQIINVGGKFKVNCY